MSHSSFGESVFHRRLLAASSRLRWIGTAMLVLGIAAIIFPMVSTLVATIFVGWVLLVGGIIALVSSFSIHGAGPFFASLLLGLLSLAAGLFLLVNPLAGALALTLLAGMVFMVQGAFELVFAFEMRPLGGWVGVLLSAVASILMALLIIAGWPGISLVVLGMLLGVNFISTGLSYLFVARAMSR